MGHGSQNRIIGTWTARKVIVYFSTMTEQRELKQANASIEKIYCGGLIQQAPIGDDGAGDIAFMQQIQNLG
jgi:hypothetical protein